MTDSSRLLPPDQAARQEITTDGLRRTLFVEAGAGSGKTTQLVDRVVNLVMKGHARLAEIAAITFTDAAAAELRDRIRVRFEQIATDSTLSYDDRRLAVDALADADLAAITTLHGFAKRVLSEHPTAAGLPPRVEVLDEINSQLDVEARWTRFVDRLHDDPEQAPLITRATLVNAELEPRYTGQATLKAAAAILTDNWDRIGTLTERQFPPLAEIDFSAYDSAVDALEAHLDDCINHDDILFDRLVNKLLPKMRMIRYLDHDAKLRALQAESSRKTGKWGPGNGGKKDNWNCDPKDVKSTINYVLESAGAVVGVGVDDVLDRLLCLTAIEVLSAARRRQREGVLEFHDLLVLAREMLQKSPAARYQLHHRYTHLLLDEFQDTDPIQIDLAVLIAASINWGASTDRLHTWRDAHVEDGRLFFVGDPKQSIYRFRRADIGLFLDARDRFGVDGALLELSTNFRTVPPVVDWVNNLFSELMSGEGDRSQPHYQPLKAFRSDDSGADHRPVLIGGPTDSVRANELREIEARDVARTIVDIREHPEKWPVRDGSSWRPAELRDITILVPTRTSLPQLREALDAHDIHFRLDTGTLVYSTQEVRDLLAAIRAIADPTDEISLVAALRSPYFACSDRDLFEWRHAGGRWNLVDDPPEGLTPDHPVALAFARLRSLWEQRRWIGPSDLVDMLTRQCRADLLAFADGHPRDVWRRLRFFVDQARLFEDNGGSGLRSFVEWAELQSADAARIHEPLLPETDETSVRIMTIHGSKGLEFPITILSGMTTKPRSLPTGIAVLWDDDGAPSLSLGKGIATSTHDPRADLEGQMGDKEKQRLLYVACTRARDHLIVSTHHKGDSFAKQVWDTMNDNSRSRTFDEAVVSTVESPIPAETSASDSSSSAREHPSFGHPTWAARHSEITQMFSQAIGGQRPSSVSSATAIAAAARNPDRSANASTIAEIGGLDPDAADDSTTVAIDDEADGLSVHRRGRRGTALGSAVHAVLEHLDFTLLGVGGTDAATESARTVLSEAVTSLSQRFAHDEGIADDAPQVEAMVRSALRAPIIELAATCTHHKEVYVAAPVGDAVVEGYVDLLIETPDGLIVVDYKTDTVDEHTADEKAAHYELQAATYAVALESSTGLRVIDCRFVFCRPKGPIERAVADLEASTQRVAEFLAQPS